VSNHIIHEGELSKQVERQKNLLTRWIILNKDALLIYKDKLNSRSFPEKPLVCIPLVEIQSVKENEVQKKGGKNVNTELIINLRDCLSNIE
jgi:PH domain